MPTPDHKPHYEQSAELKALLAAQRPTPRWLYRLRRWLRGLFAVLVLAGASPIVEAQPLDIDRLLPALSKVESNGNPRAVGDSGKAYGELQIWSVVVQDVNRTHGTRYTHRDDHRPRHPRRQELRTRQRPRLLSRRQSRERRKGKGLRHPHGLA